MSLFRLNGTVLSWNSASFKVDGIGYSGITSIKYGQKRERPQVYGMRKNGTPLGKVAGKYSATCSMTWLRDEYDDFTTQLTLKGLGSYGDATFDWTLTFFEPNLLVPQPPIVIIGTGCTIESEDDDNQEGTDALVTNCEINVLGITRNGKQLFSAVRTFDPT